MRADLVVEISKRKMILIMNDKFLIKLLFFYFASLILLISFSFFYHFDITDEGYYLYLLSNGNTAKIEATKWYVPFHYIGKLFNHSIFCV